MPARSMSFWKRAGFAGLGLLIGIVFAWLLCDAFLSFLDFLIGDY